MHQSIRQISVLVAAIAAAVSTTGAHAQAAAPASAASIPVRVGGEHVRIAGQVTDINTEKREVTLRTDDGRELKFGVDPSLKLEKLSVGDRVEMEYLVAVALALKKGGGEERQKVEEELRAENPAGGPAGGVRGRRTTLVADVLSIDRAEGTVRLRGPEGRIVEFKVGDKSRLEQVKTGDQVVAVVEEALAVDIHPSSAMGAAPAASSASSPSR